MAVFGDIRESRKLGSRITLRDEFQGFLLHGKNLVNIVQEIKMRLYPVEIRFGIGK